MINEESKTRYSQVAYKAYVLLTNKTISAMEAWKKAAQEIIQSESTRDKGCPRSTFIGLCESGHLNGIDKIRQSEAHNYLYAKFAITKWKKNPAISKPEMWRIIRKQFPKGAINHQGQLDVVCGLWKYIK